MQLSTRLFLLCAACMLTACSASTTERLNLPPLKTVEQVDLQRYMGTWYEIASYPQSFQRGCAGTSATYSLRNDGKVKVVNRCFDQSLDGEERVATGRARVVDDSNAKLEVSFFGPFWGDYWIIELGAEYDHAVVAAPGRDYLWILSRSPQMEQDLLDSLMSDLSEVHQFDLDRLQFTQQPSAAPVEQD